MSIIQAKALFMKMTHSHIQCTPECERHWKAIVENVLNDRFPWISIDNDDCNRVFVSFILVYRVMHSVTLYVTMLNSNSIDELMKFYQVLHIMEKSLSFNQMESNTKRYNVTHKHFDAQTNKHKSVKHDMKFHTKTYFQIVFIQSFPLCRCHNDVEHTFSMCKF